MSDRPGVSLEEWYPLVMDLVATPRTVILHAGVDLAPLLYGNEEGAPDVRAEARQLSVDIAHAAEAVGGYPIFLRTGHTSGKHQWRDTCFVPDRASIPQHIYNIVEYSEMADMFGLPTEVWVVRELLTTEPAFHAFADMPVTAERRYFVVDGKVVGHHPYWPPDSLEDSDTDVRDWRKRLEQLNQQPASEIELLTALTEKVGGVLPGAWSVDWLWAQGQWWLTDMAWAEVSYVWSDHPTAPRDAW